MKKLLLVSTALVGVAFAAPAQAALKMDLGGYFAGYGVFADNDQAAERGFEFRRDNEIHVTGETTLDNGLTVGAHTEFKIAQGTNNVLTDETYAYGSSGWGRVNLGVEDGAAYLLQVAAPSADSNVDGLRTYISTLTATSAINAESAIASNGLEDVLGATNPIFNNVDYQHADFRNTDRITYLSPKFNGFQAGVSFAPETGITTGTGAPSSDATLGVVLFDSSAGATIGGLSASYEQPWEVGARWDGEFQGFGIGAGAGWSHASLQNAKATAADVNDIAGANTNAAGDWGLSDDLTTWNAGLSVAFSGFTVGADYKLASTSRVGDGNDAAGVSALSGDIENEVWVFGVGYDNGPWHVGGSYYNSQLDADAMTDGSGTGDVAASSYETDRYTVGAGYTFGPGMSFRGSVAWGEFDGGTAATSNDFQQIAVGTDIQF